MKTIQRYDSYNIMDDSKEQEDSDSSILEKNKEKFSEDISHYLSD